MPPSRAAQHLSDVVREIRGGIAGLSERLELKLVERKEFGAGEVALRYQRSRVTF